MHIKNLGIGSALSSSSFSIRVWLIHQNPDFLRGSGSLQALFCFQRVLLSSGITARSLHPPSPESFLPSFLVPLELFGISGIILQLSRAHPFIFPFPKGEITFWEGLEES